MRGQGYRRDADCRDGWHQRDNRGDGRWDHAKDYRREENGNGRRERCHSGRRRSRSRSQSTSSVDSEGHISSEVREITDRFNVIRELDRGTFGAVFKAWDRKYSEYVAVKVVRRVERYVEDALVEVDILEKLADKDRRGRYCVRLFKYFRYRGHLCIVTELLGTSLYHGLKNLRPRSDGVCALRMTTLRNVTRQLCEALEFLASVGLVHADLKTENVLLEHSEMSLEEDNPRVKLIDFGAATWVRDVHATIIQTRHYRAPEVVMGLEWGLACDMWSVGCIVLELHEGRLTFDTHDTAQHLAMMQRLSGPIPENMAAAAANGAEELFDSNRRGRRLLWPELSGGPNRRRDRKAEEEVMAVRPLDTRIPPTHSDFYNLLRGFASPPPPPPFSPAADADCLFVLLLVGWVLV